MYSFDTCRDLVDGIRAGNTTKNDITNATIGDYIWHGQVHGLLPNRTHLDMLALTYAGCVAICGRGRVALNNTVKALNIAATWVFPLAIFLSLPYDSIHRRKFRRTLEAATNWLGSPQTALTATLDNFYMIRECEKRIKEVNGDLREVARDAFYTLSCLNQFDLKGPYAQAQTQLLHTLLYGLFRPFAIDNASQDELDLLRQLLGMLAHQLRMQRKRGVIPTLSSLALWLVAFVFSIVLAFGQLGDNTTAHSLALGLLVSWLPLLVIFSIVDRNPVSTERSAVLIERWLYNVDAVRRYTTMANALPPPQIGWWSTKTPINEIDYFSIGAFIGQGRRLHYAGLTAAMLHTVKDSWYNSDMSVADFENLATKLTSRLNGHPPRAWWVVAVVSLALVLTEIMLAFMVAFMTPTIGLGCRSFAYLLVALFTSVTWVISIITTRPGRALRAISLVSNSIALLLLVAIIFIHLTGAFNNCWCKSSMLSWPMLGGYMDFHNAAFYRENFRVERYWALGAAIGGMIPLVSLLVALIQWHNCKHLWAASEVNTIRQLHAMMHLADTTWLQ